MSIKVVAGFTPKQISGCSLWFDGTDSSTITLSSGSLTQWNDKSGNGRNLTAVSGYANATVSSAFQNGLNVFNFSGNGLYRTAGSAVVYPQDCYIVVALKSTTAHVDVLGMGDTGNDNFNSLTFGEYSASRWHNGSSGFSRTPNCVSSTTETSTSFLLMQWSIANNNFLLRRNGVQLVQTASYTYGFSNSATSVFQIGFRHTNGTAANFSGYIGEIIVFNSQLGTTQQQQVESYLAQKWGLSALLPGGHPSLRTTIYRAPRAITLTMTPFFTAFSPRQIPGCALWLDGADSSTITMVTGVSQWNDKSGNGYNLTQGSTGSQPTRTGNLLNFVTNYNMNIPQAAINNASTWSMFFAVNPIASVNWFMAKQRDGVNSYNIFSTTQTGGPGPNAYFTGLTNYLYVRMFNAGTLAASSAALTMSQLQILSFVYDGTNMLIYINGNLSSTTAGSFAIQNDTSSTNFLLGQWFGNGTNYNSNGNFQLGELIYFNSSLTATQRQQVESYLAQKWGLVSSLPSGHSHLTQPAGARTTLSLVNSKMSIISRRITAFTSFRWTITAGNTDQWVQFSEFQVGNNNNQVVFVSQTTATTGSTISWNTGNGEGPVQVVDNNLNTKGLGIGTSGLVLIVTVSTPITANMYRWASANDSTPSRNPTQWTVDGSADGVTFVRLHTQNTTYAGPNTNFTYTSWINFTY